MQPPCRSRGELPRQRGRSGCIPLYCKQLCRRRQRPCAAHPWRGMWRKLNRAASERSFHATPVAKGQREKLRTPPPARPFSAHFANRSRLIHLPQHQKRALSNARRDVLGKTGRKLYHARYDLTLTTYQARYNIKRGGEPVWNAKCNLRNSTTPKGTRHEPGGRGQVGRNSAPTVTRVLTSKERAPTFGDSRDCCGSPSGNSSRGGNLGRSPYRPGRLQEATSMGQSDPTGSKTSRKHGA